MTNDASKPDELVATDPAPANDKAESDRLRAERHAKLATAEREQREAAKAKAAPTTPDAELAQLAATARATCGCEACGRLERRTPIGRQVSGGVGRPGSCVVREVFSVLSARVAR